jgi:hypothetical protein
VVESRKGTEELEAEAEEERDVVCGLVGWMDGCLPLKSKC